MMAGAGGVHGHHVHTCERTNGSLPMGLLGLSIGVRSQCGWSGSNRQGAFGFSEDPPHRGPSPARIPVSPHPPESWERPRGRSQVGAKARSGVYGGGMVHLLFRVSESGKVAQSVCHQPSRSKLSPGSVAAGSGVFSYASIDGTSSPPASTRCARVHDANP